MKPLLSVLAICWFALVSGCERKPQTTITVNLDSPTIVEAACGQCQFGMKGKKGCDLAIRYQGSALFMGGFKMDDLGDAHAKDGLCNVVRKAKVTGRSENGRFVAASFALLPE